MSDRGMKKYAPFASLIEQSICLQEMRYNKNKQDKPKISSERAEKINNILTNYKNKEVTLTYFYDGYLYEIKETIKRVDQINRKVVFASGSISFSDIVDVNVNDEVPLWDDGVFNE